MADQKETLERRQYRRFKAAKAAFVMLRPQWPNSTVLCQIIDISLSGLAFHCSSIPDKTIQPSEMDILMRPSHFHLHKIPFRAIYDIQNFDKVPSEPNGMRRCGVKFGQLTQDQRSQLENFIRHHTLGRV